MDMSTYITKLLQSSPEFSKRRRRLLIAFFVRRVLIGIQFTIIFPTAWAYVKTFHAQPWFYGLTVSVYQLSGIFVLPVAGILFDSFKITKEMVDAFNIFEMIGNLIYALPYSKWFLFGGRFISGLGGGFLGVMSSEIAWITTKEERLAIYARMELGHLVGMLCAPGLAFSVKWVDFKIGNWHVQSTNAPGILCGTLWFLYQIFTMFMVRNLAQELSQGYYVKVESEEIESVKQGKENDPLLEKVIEEDTENNPSSKVGDQQRKKNGTLLGGNYFVSVLSELFIFETTFILFSSLLIWIYIGTADVLISLFAQEDLQWSPGYTTIIYLALGVELSAVFGFIDRFGQRVKDENLLMSGLVFLVLSLSILLIYGWQRKHYPVAVALYCMAYCLGFIGFVTIKISTKSLLSKIYPREFQGVIQSSTVITLNVGCLLGPLIGSYFFTYLYFGMSIMLGMFLIATIWGFFSVEGLRKRKEMYG